MMNIVRHGMGKRLLVSVGDDIRAPEKFTVAAVTDIDWNRYLSPWPAQKVFARGEDFGGMADVFLNELLKQLQDILQEDWEDRCIIGYSLAGLFALYACTKTDVFDCCASVSGSMWYPGFTDYLKEHPVHCRRVVLSLGDKEAKTKNPVMASVADRTEEVRALLSEYIDTEFHWNPGNHFFEADQRIERALNML